MPLLSQVGIADTNFSRGSVDGLIIGNYVWYTFLPEIVDIIIIGEIQLIPLLPIRLICHLDLSPDGV